MRRLACLSGVLLPILIVASCSSPNGQDSQPSTQQPQISTPTLSPTHNPGPAPPLWQPDQFVSRTEKATIAIHHIAMSGENITLFYSIELTNVDSHERVMVLPTAMLQVGGPDDAQAPALAKVLYSGVNVSLGALSFGSLEPFDTYSLFLTLVISELTVERFSDGTKMIIDGHWEIPLIRRNSVTVRTSRFPRQSWDGRAHSDRRQIWLSTHPGGYHGHSAIGWVATRAFYFLDRIVYFMVKPDGDVIEISEEWYENIDEFLSNLEHPIE